MKVSFLVVLYGRKPCESTTIKALVLFSDLLKNANIVIWNNGPHNIHYSEYHFMKECGLQVSVAETIENIPLSWVYNKFIESFSSDYYVILDHDSSLTYEYLHDVMHSVHHGLSVPAVSCDGKLHSPKVKRNGKGRSAYSAGPFSKQDKVRAIGSGVVLSDQLAVIIKSQFGDVFDSSFAFYGVDTSIFSRVNRMGLTDQVFVISQFEHSLSNFENESAAVKQFRRHEQSIDQGLRIRYYHDRSKLRSLLWLSIKGMLGLGKTDTIQVWRSYLSGRHDRCTPENRYVVDRLVIAKI